MNNRQKSFILGIIAIGIVSFSILISAMQPPGIDFDDEGNITVSTGETITNPYWLIQEADIVGPPVDLLQIQSHRGGTIYEGYVRFTISIAESDGMTIYYDIIIYTDNTIEIITSYNSIAWIAYEGYKLPIDANTIYNLLKTEGSINASSTFENIRYSGWQDGFLVFIRDSSFSIQTQVIEHAVGLVRGARSGSAGPNLDWNLYWNGTLIYRVFATDTNYHWYFGSYSLLYGSNYTFTLTWTGTVSDHAIALIIPGSYTITDATEHFVYNMTCKPPGSRIAVKEVSPPTIFPNQLCDVRIKCDLPTATKVNITSERYPSTFTLLGNVTITKYENSTFVSEESVAITPIIEGGYYKLQIYYTDAPVALFYQNKYQWFTISYTIQAPSSGSGTQEFPSTEIQYEVPPP